MVLLKRLIISAVIFLVLLFVCASAYIHYYGKDLIESAMTNALDRKVTIEKISYRFPLSLKAKNIVIGQTLDGGKFFEAIDVTARFAAEAFSQRKLIFESVILAKPFVVIEKINESPEPTDGLLRRYGVVVPPQQQEPSSSAQDDSAEKDQMDTRSEVAIDRLILRQGRFQYQNTAIDKDFSVALEDVYLKCKHLIFPLVAGRTDFNVSGRLVKKGNPLSGSSVEGSGWVDVINRNMEADVEVIESDGTVGITASAVSKNNDMHVSGDMKFSNILMGAEKGGVAETTPVNDLISSALSSAGVEIGAKFSFNTKMDNFRPEKVSFSGSVLTK